MNWSALAVQMDQRESPLLVVVMPYLGLGQIGRLRQVLVTQSLMDRTALFLRVQRPSGRTNYLLLAACLAAYLAACLAACLAAFQAACQAIVQVFECQTIRPIQLAFVAALQRDQFRRVRQKHLVVP